MGALLSQFLNKYAYTDFHELNADWMIRTMMELINQVENFVSLNAIKYADPIQWNIVSQYEKNTVVIDPLTGTAYISVQPVPSGVALTRTEYWTVVFDLGSFVVRAAKNFSNRYEADTTLTATFPSSQGDWLVWGDTLYEVIVTTINAGDQYVVDSNIRHITMEEVIDALAQAIDAVDTKVGDLNDLTTADKTSIVNAIIEVVSSIGSLNDLTTTDNSSIVNAINEAISKVTINSTSIGDLTQLITDDTTDLVGSINSVKTNVTDIITELRDRFVFVTDFGADPTGANDSSQAFQDAIDFLGANGGRIIVPRGAYKISNTVRFNSGSILIEGDGRDATFINMDLNSYAFYVQSAALCGFKDVGFFGSNTQTAGGAILIKSPMGCYIDHCFFDRLFNGVYIDAPNTVYNWITDCMFMDCDNIAITLQLVGGLTWISNVECYRCLTGIKIVNAWDLVYITDIEIFGSVGVGMDVNPTASGMCDIFMVNSLVDTSGDVGIIFNGSNCLALTRIFLSNCWSSGSAKFGIYIKDVRGAIFNNCYMLANKWDGVFVDTDSSFIDFNNCYICGNSYDDANNYSGITIADNAQFIHILGGGIGSSFFTMITAPQHSTDPSGFNAMPNYQKYGVNIASAAVQNVVVENCNIGLNVTAPIYNASSDSGIKFRNNIGYNPKGFITVPIPPSGSNISNSYNVDMIVYCEGIDNFILDGVDLGAATCVLVPAGKGIGILYSGTPTWHWYGL